MVGPAIAAVGSALLPQVTQGLANMGGQYLQNKFAANQGQSNIGDSQKVVDYIKANNLQVDPDHVAALQEKASRENADFQQGVNQQANLFGAALGSNIANNNATRASALNAQSNAATLAGQQMQNAANRAQATGNMISGAMQSAMGLSR